MEESVMEIAHTDCSIPIDHEVAVSPVTRVPIESVSLMKEIHMEEDEYLRIKVAQSWNFKNVPYRKLKNFNNMCLFKDIKSNKPTP